MTRRVVKVQPPGEGYELATCISTTGNKRDEGRHHWLLRDGLNVLDGAGPHFTCPYGYPGDRLWVREAWRTLEGYDAMPPRDIPLSAPIWYEADGPAPAGFGRYRHARFMPRWVSRSMDEIVGIRVERLQEISDSDAFAEGVEKTSYGCHKHTPGGFGCMTGRDGYRALWESINGSGSWEANPWVWVVSFKRVLA